MLPNHSAFGNSTIVAGVKRAVTAMSHALSVAQTAGAGLRLFTGPHGGEDLLDDCGFRIRIGVHVGPRTRRELAFHRLVAVPIALALPKPIPKNQVSLNFRRAGRIDVYVHVF